MNSKGLGQQLRRPDHPKSVAQSKPPYGEHTTTIVLNKLQRVQNSAARLLTGTRSREHITPVLRELHWLPIKHRINFEILLITYKALNSLAPPYLADLLHHHAPSRFLRSISANLLKVPRTKRRTWGDRAFSVAAPTLWNSLPSHIKVSPTLSSFKSALKTYLFTLTFPT